MTPLLPAFTGAPSENAVYHTDCFTLLRAMPDASVDAIITDMPYGTTACTWDTVVDLPRWWQSVKRVLKPRGVMVTTASQPFTSALVMSNPAWFKYEWIWEKSNATFFQHAKNAPLRLHENVLVFSGGVVNHKSMTDNRMNYYPQMTPGTPYKSVRKKPNVGYGSLHNASKVNMVFVGNVLINDGTRYPTSVLHFPSISGSEHPTQKPVPLYEYLSLTYTAPGDLIVDPFCGSGTTLLAARNLNRRFIGGDITPEYVDIARRRLAQPYTVNMFESLMSLN